MAVVIGRHGSPFEVSMALGAFFLGIGSFAPVWGALTDYTGKRRIILIVSSLLATLSIFPLVIYQSIWISILIRFVYGGFVAGFLPALVTIVGERGESESRGKRIGFLNSSRMAGGAGGRICAGFLLGILLPPDLYLVVFGVSLAASIPAFLIEDPTPSKDYAFSFTELKDEIRRRVFPPEGERSHLNTHGLKWLYVSLGLRHTTVKGVGSLLPVFITAALGASEFAMGILMALNPAFQTVFMLISGRLADSVGRKPLIVFGMGGSGVYGLVAAASTLPETLLYREIMVGLALVIVALSFSALSTGAMTFIGDVSPIERESELQGLRSTVISAGGVAGPVLVGSIAVLTDFETSYILISILAFVAMFITRWKLVESK
ncbi:hypothetical protein AKJ57_06490 [candidate division MSBL1 archaeon SCGC-AAA259A05]|uniref:Major facilitator superfamily (MFS) profile domain-containing protein n=1 Tax=candidate division MSBL1 archaeon SCGC-AAA259A05 TaxID=1698259 RepID=A0A133U3B3_9EURY|nr:hypothetical protein AKJ57_06490 [candidate division MSBL1 archaeon SCGC-AAA259A05]